MTPETYTRDSDDEWETILPNRIDYQQPGYEYRYQKRKIILEPEPMPDKAYEPIESRIARLEKYVGRLMDSVRLKF